MKTLKIVAFVLIALNVFAQDSYIIGTRPGLVLQLSDSPYGRVQGELALRRGIMPQGAVAACDRELASLARHLPRVRQVQGISGSDYWVLASTTEGWQTDHPVSVVSALVAAGLMAPPAEDGPNDLYYLAWREAADANKGYLATLGSNPTNAWVLGKYQLEYAQRKFTSDYAHEQGRPAQARAQAPTSYTFPDCVEARRMDDGNWWFYMGGGLVVLGEAEQQTRIAQIPRAQPR